MTSRRAVASRGRSLPPARCAHSRLTICIIRADAAAPHVHTTQAFFSAPSTVIHGPSTIEELRTHTACSSGPAVLVARRYARAVIEPPPSLLSQAESLEWCVSEMQAGRASVLIQLYEILNDFVRERCDTLGWRPGIRFGEQRFGLLGFHSADPQECLAH